MDTPYSLPPLPYEPWALEPHISGEIVELHHDRHHAAYVKGANEALEGLERARLANDYHGLTRLERDLSFHVAGHLLHSVMWSNLHPEGGGEPTGSLAEHLVHGFGGVARFKHQMAATALTVQGSGWAVAAWEPVTSRIAVFQVHGHVTGLPAGAVPLLVIDSWEHAYYLQYRNHRQDYVSALWNIVNWDDVGARLERASRTPTLVPVHQKVA